MAAGGRGAPLSMVRSETSKVPPPKSKTRMSCMWCSDPSIPYLHVATQLPRSCNTVATQYDTLQLDVLHAVLHSVHPAPDAARLPPLPTLNTVAAHVVGMLCFTLCSSDTACARCTPLLAVSHAACVYAELCGPGALASAVCECIRDDSCGEACAGRVGQGCSS